MKYKSTPPIEVITWADHSANHAREEYTVSEIERRTQARCMNRNVGFVVHEDDEKIIIAHEARIDADMDEVRFSHYTTILKAVIETRRKYKG